MKRYKQLYETIYGFPNLLEAACKARRGKRHEPPVAAFHHRLETELLTLERELREQTYQPGAYRTFTIHDTKPRLISAAPFRDRVVHHALCNIIEPLFEPTFIYDSYACRVGKGSHAAVNRLTAFMQRADYVLKCDIRKYFPSIDHEILKGLLRRKIGCERTLWLLDTIIDASNPQDEVTDYFPGDDLLTPLTRRRGLPIGNQTSQFFANVYLNPLDHFLKETRGCRYLIRYADDFVVLGDDRTVLWETKAAIDDFIATRLRLRIPSQKHFVCPVTVGIDFLGYRVFPTHRLIRRSSGVRFARRLVKMQQEYSIGQITREGVRQRIASWIGHASHADTWGLRRSLLGNAVFKRAQVRAAVPGTTPTRTTSDPRTETGTTHRSGTTTTTGSVVSHQHSLAYRNLVRHGGPERV